MRTRQAGWTAALTGLTAAAVVVLGTPALASGGGHLWLTTSSATRPLAAASRTATAPAWTYTRASSPARTLVKDSAGTLLATFTDGARTAVLTGSSRTFGEPSTTSATVTTKAWVRLLPAAFAGTVDTAWLTAELADTSADLLAVAAQYAPGAAAQTDATGRQFAGDASYGPLQADGTRQEGSDWNDYLGTTATYDGVADAPEVNQFRSLDCSGFTRMVFGYRGGLPMTLTPDGVRLPRRAVQMYDGAPGKVLIPNAGVQATALSALQAGDLVFFDASTNDGTAIDHVGIYLGKDSGNHHRFVSSRKTADGPTMGDLGGTSRLDGTGLYAGSFRAARRL